MADEILRRDENSVTVLGGITDDSNQYIKMLRVNPSTGRLLVSGAGGSISITDGSTTVNNVTELNFTSNATVTDGGGGIANIAITAGGGFSALAPTETPNGILTVFTFSGASAQPSYVVADGAWNKAVAKDGVVNWTWNNGAKQVTMTIPPTDDIFGVV